MKLPFNCARALLPLFVVAGLSSAALRAQDNLTPPPDGVTPAPQSDTRYGWFNALDHRSWYNQGDFPEPFLVDDSGLEINEARLDWLHSEAPGQQDDIAAAEVEKGFGQLTLELRVPYERAASAGAVEQGVGNIELGARHPVYQFVSPKGWFDMTLGAAMEVGVPVYSPVSRNTELVPRLFDDFRLGENFTVQSVVGYSTLLGGGEEGGVQTFEYGLVFGYSIQHEWLPVPGVQQVIPMFELLGERQLTETDAGRNSVLGNAAVRCNLNPVGRVQPRLGVGFVFPVTSDARAEVHWGIFTSLVFEY